MVTTNVATADLEHVYKRPEVNSNRFQWYGKTRVTSYELRITSCELQVRIHELRVRIHELRIRIDEFKNHLLVVL